MLIFFYALFYVIILMVKLMEYLNIKFKTKDDDYPTIFHHFKGGDYHIITIGINSETNEKMVVYQNIVTNDIWIRPALMFFSKMNKDKYPDINQEYRFEIRK